MQIIETTYQYFTQISTILVSFIIISHVMASLWPRKRLPLDESSLIIITGGCMGIGKQMALQFAKKYHCTILIIDRRDDLFEALGKQLQEFNCKPLFKKTDLSDDHQIAEVIQYIQTIFPKIDLFIYNAGIVIPKLTFQGTQAENKLVMKINYFTPIEMIHGLESKLKGGHVAVVSSLVAFSSGGIYFGTYGASKGAIWHYLSSLRQEYKKYKKNISISIACPYAINTGMFHGIKMAFEFLIPVLDQTYVGKRLAKEFVARKEVCLIKQYAGWILKLVELLPSQLIDLHCMFLYNSNFSTIVNKHDDQVKEMKSL